MSDTSTNIGMFSESNDNMEDIIDILNDHIEELEQKVAYYKNKANERFMNNVELHVEHEQLKKRIDNSKSILQCKLPDYMSYIVTYV